MSEAVVSMRRQDTDEQGTPRPPHPRLCDPEQPEYEGPLLLHTAPLLQVWALLQIQFLSLSSAAAALPDTALLETLSYRAAAPLSPIIIWLGWRIPLLDHASAEVGRIARLHSRIVVRTIARTHRETGLD